MEKILRGRGIFSVFDEYIKLRVMIMSQKLMGGAVKEHLLRRVKEDCRRLKAVGAVPCLGLFRLGAKAGDLSYERGVMKTMTEAGIAVETVALPAEVSFADAESALGRLCRREDIDGVLPLMPLPAPFGELAALVPPEKDVDGLLGTRSCFTPCTPEAALAVLDFYHIDLAGKNVAVLGRSPLVGRPLAALLRERGALVSVVHSRTEHPQSLVRTAEIVCSAVGKPRLLDESYLRAGQTVLDIGVNADPRREKGICGDLDEAAGEKLALRYTPVPGGIGEATVAVLAEHVVLACEKRRCRRGEISCETR